MPTPGMIGPPRMPPWGPGPMGPGVWCPPGSPFGLSAGYGLDPGCVEYEEGKDEETAETVLDPKSGGSSEDNKSENKEKDEEVAIDLSGEVWIETKAEDGK